MGMTGLFDELSSELRQLSNDQVHERTFQIAKKEQRTTLEVLHHLHEINRRRVFAALGYSSLWEYCVKALSYSESAAAERVNAMRLMFSVNEAQKEMEAGRLNLTQASKVQRFFQMQAKHHQRRYDSAEKTKLIQEVSGKSKTEVEKLLLKKSPNELNTAQLQPERLRPISPTQTELKFAVNEETMLKLQEVKNLKGDLPLAQIFDQALEAYLEQIHPLKKKKPQFQRTPMKPKTESAASVESTFPAKSEKPSGKPSRYTPASVKRAIWRRSQGQCEYHDPKTDKRCQSRYQLQYEHQIPFSWGGHSTAENLQHFCASHNQLKAIEQLGQKKMARYLDNDYLE